jgi:hypothetical protein
MAVRLNVLVLRPPGNGSAWHAQCDDAIGQLLGRPGLDLTLLERLPQPGDGSTERLALESIGGHVACLAWQDPADLLVDLQHAGRPMIRRRHAGDPECEHDVTLSSHSDKTANAGRMYFFDMRGQRHAPSILDALQALLKTLQVPTFQIASLTAMPSTTKPTSVRPVKPKPVAIAPHSVKESSRNIPPISPARDDLDRLVDELDELDI